MRRCSTRLVAVATIFVRLLDEGVDVWRPVPATALGNGQYRLLQTDDYDPETENWEFLPGVTVTCELRSKSGDRIMVATRVV